MKSRSTLIFLFFTAPVFANASYSPVCGLMDRAQGAMNVVASNLANVNTTRTPEGGPYLVQELICASDVCEVEEIAKTKRVYEPSHIDADPEGFVTYPDIDVSDEISTMLMLVRIYEKAATVCRGPADSN